MKKFFNKSTCIFSGLLGFILVLLFICGILCALLYKQNCIDKNISDFKTIVENSNVFGECTPSISNDSIFEAESASESAEASASSTPITWPKKEDDTEDQNYVINSDDPVSIAKVYLELYNAKQWGTNSTHTICRNEYGDFAVNIRQGEIYVDDEATGVKTEGRLFYDKLCELYLSGEWDGSKTEIEGQTVFRDTYDGEISIFSGSISLDKPYENIDIPASFDTYVCDFKAREYTYVPGHGTYTVVNHTLQMFLRGETIVLPGGPLDLHWDKDFERIIIYFESTDTLYIVERDYENDTKYVYSVPDLNYSRVKFIGLFPLDL